MANIVFKIPSEIEGGYNFKWQGNYTPDGTSKMLLKYKIKWYYEVYKFN